MENQINLIAPSRDIETITQDIIRKTQAAQAMAVTYAIEIGGHLKEAKAILSHGEWGNWLKEKVSYSQSTANSFMRLHDEYGDTQLNLFNSNSQAIMNLSYTKVLKLLAIPADEREEFIEENNVDEISTRELDKLIKERDEAIERAKAAERLEAEKQAAEKEVERGLERQKQLAEQTENLKAELITLQNKLTAAKENNKKAKAKLQEIKENPEIPQELTDKLKAEAESKAAEKANKKLEQQLASVKEKIEAAELAKKAAEHDAAKAQQAAAELENKLKMANPDVAAFRVLFISAQETIQKLKDTLEKVKSVDEEMGAKFAAVFNDFMKKSEV